MQVRRPTLARSAMEALRAVRQIAVSAGRGLTVDTLRKGRIDLRQFGPAARALAAGGLAVIAAFLAGLILSDALRGAGPLLPLGPAAGDHVVPAWAVPPVLIAVTIAWGYGLAGAVLARPAIRLAVTLLYLCFGVAPLSTQLSLAVSGSEVPGGAGLALLALLLALMALIPRSWPLSITWSLLTAAHGGLVLLALAAAGRAQALLSDIWFGTLLVTLLQNLQFITVPMLAIAGLGWADFGRKASGWVARATEAHASRALVVALLLALLGARLLLLGAEVAGGRPEERLAGWAGAALFCAGLPPIAWWRRRRPGGRLPSRWVAAIAAGISAPLMLLLAGQQLVENGLLLALPYRPDLEGQLRGVGQAFLQAAERERELRALITLAAGLALAGLGLRRRNHALAAYGAIVAWSHALFWLYQPGRPLAPLAFSYGRDVDAVVLIALASWTLALLARGALTRERAIRLLGLAVLMALFSQPDFLGDPFAPLLGAAGVLFVAFGIAWSVLTGGGAFVKGATEALPRESRLLLYVGYTLLTASLTFWFYLSGLADARNVISQYIFLVLGLPVAYLALADGGAPLLAAEEDEEAS